MTHTPPNAPDLPKEIKGQLMTRQQIAEAISSERLPLPRALDFVKNQSKLGNLIRFRGEPAWRPESAVIAGILWAASEIGLRDHETRALIARTCKAWKLPRNYDDLPPEAKKIDWPDRNPAVHAFHGYVAGYTGWRLELATFVRDGIAEARIDGRISCTSASYVPEWDADPLEHEMRASLAIDLDPIFAHLIRPRYRPQGTALN